MGSWVRIKDDAFLPNKPLPRIVKEHPQRVANMYGDNDEFLVLERWILRMEIWAKMFGIPRTMVTEIPEDKVPINSCLLFAFNQRDSAIESYERNRCKICSYRHDKCEWFLKEHKGKL